MKLGHANIPAISSLARRNLLKADMSIQSESICDVCEMSKSHAQPFTGDGTRAIAPLEVVHSDVGWYYSTPSLGGAQCFVTFIDDYSRFTAVYPIKSKDFILDAFIEYKVEAENRTGRKLRVLRSDQRTEYMAASFQKYLKAHGIKDETSTAGCAQQNGLSERSNRTLVETARCLLYGAELPERLWAEALNTAAFLRNLIPKKCLGLETPEFLFDGKRSRYDSIFAFGSTAYVKKKAGTASKFGAQAKKLVLVGYEMKKKAYRCYDRETNKVVIAHHVTFDESHVLHPRTNIMLQKEDIDCGNTSQKPLSKGEFTEKAKEAEEVANTDNSELVPLEKEKRTSERIANQPRQNYKALALVGEDKTSIVEGEPVSFKQALESLDKEKWRVAMNSELESLQKRGTWELVKLPPGKNLVTNKWVYKIKKNEFGEPIKFKARLVARGFSQIEGLDYDKTFAPTAKLEAFRCLLSVANQKHMTVHQIDIDSAYLYASIDEEVYMAQPFGFEDGTDRVCRLKKGLYGLKQAGKAWHSELTTVLESLGLKQLKSEEALFQRTNELGNLYLLVYVDDIVLAGTSLEIVNKFKLELSSYFDIKDLGEISKYLGVVLKRSSSGFTLSQRHYIMELLC